MPYVKQERRVELDEKIEKIFDEELSFGDLNYIISRIIKNLMERATKVGKFNYDFCNSIIGVLECAKQEFYNRVVTPYESVKIQQNGDLYIKR